MLPKLRATSLRWIQIIYKEREVAVSRAAPRMRDVVVNTFQFGFETVNYPLRLRSLGRAAQGRLYSTIALPHRRSSALGSRTACALPPPGGSRPRWGAPRLWRGGREDVRSGKCRGSAFLLP